MNKEMEYDLGGQKAIWGVGVCMCVCVMVHRLEYVCKCYCTNADGHGRKLNSTYPQAFASCI